MKTYIWFVYEDEDVIKTPWIQRLSGTHNQILDWILEINHKFEIENYLIQKYKLQTLNVGKEQWETGKNPLDRKEMEQEKNT